MPHYRWEQSCISVYGVDDGDGNKQSTGGPLRQQGPNPLQRSAFKLFGRNKAAAAPFPPHLGHLLSHSIFDGDGIFLNKQGDRMRRAKLTPKDYHTPTSADIMVNAFRRWLDKAVEGTRAAGKEQAASAASGDNKDVYKDNRPRAELLDRYLTHTASCSICQTELKSLKDKRRRLSVLSTALIGATGASGVLLACTTVLSLMTRV